MAYFICEKQGRCCPHEFYNSIEQAIDDSEDGVPCDHLVEVSPVRHGRWLYEPKFGSTRPYHCSLPDCGASYPVKFSYCPNCGAKMDLEATV